MVVITLYDSAFSPFARKVRMVLEHKGLPFEAVDGLLKSNHAALKSVNGRVEVPALTDGDITVVNSADIVAYLEFRYPETPVYPAEPAARVAARAWERTADTLVDAVLVNLSYWKLLERDDTMPGRLMPSLKRLFLSHHCKHLAVMGDGRRPRSRSLYHLLHEFASARFSDSSQSRIFCNCFPFCRLMSNHASNVTMPASSQYMPLARIVSFVAR